MEIIWKCARKHGIIHGICVNYKISWSQTWWISGIIFENVSEIMKNVVYLQRWSSKEKCKKNVQHKIDNFWQTSKKTRNNECLSFALIAHSLIFMKKWWFSGILPERVLRHLSRIFDLIDETFFGNVHIRNCAK